MGSDNSQVVPPLPPGFELEAVSPTGGDRQGAAPEASASPQASVPALPPGFEIEAQQPVQPVAAPPAQPRPAAPPQPPQPDLDAINAQQLQAQTDATNAPAVPGWADKPLIPVPPIGNEGGPIATGITKAVAGFASGLTSPKSLALLAGTWGLGSFTAPAMRALNGLVSAGFSIDMLRNAAKQAPQLIQQIRHGDTEGAAETLTSMGLGAGMGIASGKHAFDTLPHPDFVNRQTTENAQAIVTKMYTSTGQEINPAPPEAPPQPVQPVAAPPAPPAPPAPKAPAVVDPLARKRGEKYSVWQTRIGAKPAAKPAEPAAEPAAPPVPAGFEVETPAAEPAAAPPVPAGFTVEKGPASEHSKPTPEKKPKKTPEEVAAELGYVIQQPKKFRFDEATGQVVKIEPEKAQPAKAALPEAPAPVAPFSVQMREAKTANEGRAVLTKHAEHFNALEKAAGLTPSVGQITPTYSRGYSTLKPTELKKAVKAATAKDKVIGARLQAMVDDYPEVDKAWQKLHRESYAKSDEVPAVAAEPAETPDLEALNDAALGEKPKPTSPVTPQVPNEPGTKYVLPGFVTEGLSKGGKKGRDVYGFRSDEAQPTDPLAWAKAHAAMGKAGTSTQAVMTKFPQLTFGEADAIVKTANAAQPVAAPAATPETEAPKAKRAKAIRDQRKKGKSFKDAVAAVDSEGATPRPDTIGSADFGALGTVPAGTGEGTPGAGPAGSGPAVNGQADNGGVQQLPGGGDVSGHGGGSDAGDLDEPVAPAPRPSRRQPRPADTRPRLTGYRITNADHLGEGSPQEKALANLEAIRVMKLAEAEARPATLDEQRKLVKYTGWGALANVFEHYQASAWERAVHADLKELLTPEEWKTAAATTPNAHYTSPLVIQGMWGAVERLGIKAGASILEPGMGSGNFFGLIPDSLLPSTKLAGVELDPVTARIAALLYPNAGTFATGFEKTRFPNDWFDLAISNVPFGNYGVHDPAFKADRRGLTNPIHTYFFAKALDKVRPGGVIAFITSRYTMDTADPAAREYLSQHAKLLGAIRLPQTAFEKNAGTTVVTDVIFLQKRLPGDASPGESWTQAPETNLFPGDKDNPRQNEYYSRHPENILGTVKGNRGRFGPEINVLGQLDPVQLATALMRLPENVVTDRAASQAFKPDAIAIAEYPALGTLKPGAYGLKDGKIVRRNGEMLEPVTLAKETAARVTGMIGVRDAMHDVFRTQLQDKPEAEITAARKELGKLYDRFVARFGALNDRENRAAFKDDPDAQPILALEKVDQNLKTVSKTDIFTQATLQTYRPVSSVETAKEAMTVSLNEYGRINLARMAALTGLDPAEILEELGDLAYRDPATNQWQPADEYLSGDIRQKLAQAKDIAKTDPDYQRNVTALEAAKPVDLVPGEIVARLGAPWIPTNIVEQFVRDLLALQPGDVSVAYSPTIATWRLVLSRGQGGAKNTAEWAGGDMNADELIESAMNMKVPTVKVKISSDPDQYAVDPKKTAAAQDMQQKIKNRFKDWVWESPTRADGMAKLYNDIYNGIRLREYDGSHLTLQGANPAIDLRKHQKNAIWRVVSSGRNTLLAHVVGAGKTFEMIGAAMELRRLGLAKKPMITVPANIVGQFGRDFRKLYPAANILVADETTFNAANRQKAMAQVATGNWDAVVISHDAFGLLPIDDETFNAFLQKEIDELEDAIREMKKGKAGDKIQKELEKSKKRLETKLRKKADREGKDTGLTFEQLGIDALFVDEADMFKNLYFTTRATRIAGIPNSESNRAFDMLIKSRHVTDKTGGRLIFATGTPIANTVAEMYTMLRYLSHKELEARGLGQFDAWAQQFGESVTGLETSPDGAGFRVNTRFAKFSNLPELQSLFRQVADVQTADMLKLPVPKLFNGKYETISIPASQTLLDYIMAKDEHGHFLPGTLMGRIAAIKTGRVDPKKDNMLKVTSDGRKAALDLRLIGENVDPPDSKVNTAIDRIYQIWDEGKDKRTTQMVFSDLSTPNAERWNVYDEIRRKLTLKGVPAGEIAYAHDADTEAKKKTLIAKVNAGEVRVLIGSTGKMGAGTNAQERLIALHHLDVPWRPRDVEQREGRIRRQGNTNPEVHIIRYVTAPSFDAYMWGLVTRKAKFIEQVMTGKLGVREAEDIGGDSLGAAEAEAAATGNPLIKEKADIDNQVMRLGALESEHARKQISARIEHDRAKANIERSTIWMPRLEADIATRDKNTGEKFSMTVGKRTYDERKAAGEALNKFAIDRRMDEEPAVAGSYRGFELRTQGLGAERKVSNGSDTWDTNLPRLSFHGEATHHANLSDSPLGTLQSLDHEIKGLDRSLEQAQTEVQTAKANMKQYAITAETPFADGALLDRLQARQRELIKLLDLGSNAQPAEDSATGGAGKEAEPEKNPESGAVSLQLLTLGIPEFLAEDVAPTLRDAAMGIRDTADDILKVLAPTLRDRFSQLASLILRGKLAELARKSDMAQAALDTAERYFKSRAASENFDFIDRMELGQRQATAELDHIAFVLRTLLDDGRAAVQSLGTGKLQTFITDYFPHIWKKPQRAASVFGAFFGKRPLEGGKAFLKRRKIPTIADGRALGLEPVTDNPVTLALLKRREMDRYVMAHETLADWKTNGLAQFVRGIKLPPKGWARINDSISTVYGRNAAGETIVRGHYYAPEGAARIMNNYLSPGLREYGAYRVALGLNNVLNQFQLGLSAFHLGFTAADTTVSKAALGFQALLTGKPIKAAKFFAQTPTAAFTTFLQGNKMLKEWYRPGSQGAAIGALVDNLVTAGGRARMDAVYRTQVGEKMMEALRHGNLLGALIRSPFAGVEWTSNLIMNEVVPRMKLGAFADMARFHMAELGPNATFEDARRVLTQDWNSIENRLGEMTYDNLFWDKIAKDIAMLSVRSVGWNLGTLREIGGGFADVAVQPVRALKGEPVNLNRISYLLGLVTVNAIMSATYQYFKTGKPPDELEDYFFPRNGETDEHGHAQRVSWPTYVKDVYHYGTHPIRTLESKIAPIWSAFAEMIHNRDFYGVEIRNPDDPLVQQLQDLAKHAAESFVPIGVRNYQRETKLGAGLGTRAEQFVGVTPAPTELNESPAERLAHELRGAHIPDEARTPGSAERRDLRQSMTRALHEKKPAPKEVVEARRQGKLSKRDIAEAIREARETPLARAFNGLGIDDAVKVYRKATAAEKRTLQPMFMRKARTAIENAAPADRAKRIDEVRAALSGTSR